jgi:uncharacterized protein
MSRQEDRESTGSTLAGAVIDSLQFALEGRRLEGSMPVAALERLADELADKDGALAWQVRGERDGEGKSWLWLSVQGSLNLHCQRCLGAVAQPLDIRSRLLLVPPGVAWPEDLQDGGLADDASDAIEASAELALLPLVEEEVLLALPIAPRHESCRPPMAAGEEQELSPFAALAKIRKH